MNFQDAIQGYVKNGTDSLCEHEPIASGVLRIVLFEQPRDEFPTIVLVCGKCKQIYWEGLSKVNEAYLAELRRDEV